MTIYIHHFYEHTEITALQSGQYIISCTENKTSGTDVDLCYYTA